MILLLVQVCSQNHFCNPGSEGHCSCLERFNRRHQISRGIGFEHEPTSASFQYFANDDFGTLIWPHFGHLMWPHLIYSDRSSYPVPASRDGEGDGQETQGGTV